MRRSLPHLLALALGVGAALLAACGSSTKGGIPQGDASVLKGQLEDVRQRVADGQCDGLSKQLREVDTAIDGLPQSVDARLVSALRNGSDRLQANAVSDCNANNVPTETQTTETPTVTETNTTPPETTTTPPPTTTTPPATTTVPPATTTPPPATTPAPTTTPPVTPPPPQVSPGGGTPPQIP